MDDAETAEPLDDLFSHDLQLSRWAVVGALGILATFAVWAYAYSGLADRPAPDALEDPAFAQQAEVICTEALSRFDAMPGALDAETHQERAQQVRDSTVILDSMVADLRSTVGGTPHDQAVLTAWLDEWDIYLGDRYNYADAVEQDPAAPFLVTDTGSTERLEKRITRFAKQNHMASCSTPLDIG